MKKTFKQNLLESFLNSEVNKIGVNIFEWRGKYYQVLTYKQIIKIGSKVDHFSVFSLAGKEAKTPRPYKNLKPYYFRELSDQMLRKYHLTKSKQSDNI